MSTWRQCNTADEDRSLLSCPMSRLAHVVDPTCRHFRHRPSGTMVFVYIGSFVSRTCCCVTVPTVPSAAARQIRAGQGGGIRRWVVAVRSFDLNGFARANRVSVRVRFPLGGSKMARPKIVHVDIATRCYVFMSTCWPVLRERYDMRFGGFDSMASSSMPSTNRVVDTSTFRRAGVSN